MPRLLLGSSASAVYRAVHAESSGKGDLDRARFIRQISQNYRGRIMLIPKHTKGVVDELRCQYYLNVSKDPIIQLLYERSFWLQCSRRAARRSYTAADEFVQIGENSRAARALLRDLLVRWSIDPTER